MVAFLTRWLRATFEYNPSFPLSAMALLVGLRLLAGDGGPNPHDVTILEAAVGLGILQAYELALLGTVLFVLWPRKIAHETNVSLIVFGVVRCAAPFVVISLAADGQLAVSLVAGAALWALMAVKTRVVSNALRLELRGWERRLDGALYGVACLGLPLLAHQLSAATGLGISYQTARVLLVVACWAFAAALAPLCLGLDGVRRHAGLNSHPAIVWRGLTGCGVTALLLSALWLAGDTPPLIALLPLGLIALALANRITLACGKTPPRWVIHAPAAVSAFVVLADASTLSGALPLLPHPLLVLAFLIVAGLALPLIDPARARHGLWTLAAVATAAPLRFAPDAAVATRYVFCAALAVAALGAVRRRDPLLTHGALVALLVGVYAFGPTLPAAVGATALTGAAVAVVVALRFPGLGIAGRLATVLVVGSAGWFAIGGATSLPAIGNGLLTGAALLFLAQRHDVHALRYAAGFASSAALVRHLGGNLDPGVALVALAFAGLPLGAWVAIRREDRLAQERARADEPPDLDELEALPGEVNG